MNAHWNRHIQLIALWMSVLIIGIPLVSAQESAFLLTRFSGRDNVDGYARSNDQFQIGSQAKVFGETQITKDQARIFYGSEFKSFFTGCTQQTGSDFWNCYYNETLAGASGTQAYT